MHNAMTPLGTQDEFPHDVPSDVELWCENFCFDGFDATSGFGFWVHLSRGQLHPTLSREVITVFFPDGTFGYWKGYGPSRDVRGAAGPTLSIIIDKAFEDLRITCLSPLQLVTGDELKIGGIGDRCEQLFEMDIKFRAAAPVWDMRRAVEGQIWATGHYEQAGLLHGSARTGGIEYTMTGTGWRDHSLGPRDNTLMKQHVWAHAVFPSGRGFGLFQHARRDTGIDLAGACIFDATSIADAKVHELTPLGSNDTEAGFSSYRLVLESDRGLETIEAEILTAYVATSAPPSQQIFGLYREGGHVRWESRTHFRWNGESAIGLTERTMPLRS